MAEADPRSKAVERIEQKRAFQKTLLGTYGRSKPITGAEMRRGGGA